MASSETAPMDVVTRSTALKVLPSTATLTDVTGLTRFLLVTQNVSYIYLKCVDVQRKGRPRFFFLDDKCPNEVLTDQHDFQNTGLDCRIFSFHLSSLET